MDSIITSDNFKSIYTGEKSSLYTLAEITSY